METTPQKPNNALTTTAQFSQKRYERSTVIAKWLDLAAQVTQTELPKEQAALFWMETLMQFPAEVIEQAFKGYLANEVDENGKVWFPRPAQIVARCEEILEVFNRKKTEGSALSDMERWKKETEGQQTYGLADVLAMMRESR